MTAFMAGVFLGLCVLGAYLLARDIKSANEEYRQWADAELCPLCERPWAECPGCQPVYLRPALCNCTDCGRNQPLKNCPECGGKGELK